MEKIEKTAWVIALGVVYVALMAFIALGFPWGR